MNKKPNLKTLPFRLPKKLNEHIIFTFLPNDSNNNIEVRGTSVLTDTIFALELAVEGEDWRSFGFGKLSTLTLKHREILYSRILNGLELKKDGKPFELELSWVWVQERKERERKKAIVVQSAVRITIARRRVKQRR